MSRKADDPIALQVRMTEGLRLKLAKAAVQNGRSLNAEIVWRLGQTLDEPRQPTLRTWDRLARRPVVAPGPARSLASPVLSVPAADTDQNLVDMAQRLEAALRKPASETRAPASDVDDPTSSALRAIADALSADELHAKPAARVYADAPDPAPPAPREKIFEQVKAAFATPREEIFEQVKAALEQILTDNEMRERVLRMKKEGGE
jgi:hypothetical protein